VSSYSVDGIKSDNDFIIELVLKLTTGEEVKNQAIYISSHSDSLGASAADMTGKAFLMYSPIAVLQGDVLQIPINAGMIKQKLSTNLNSEIDHYNLENVGVLSDLNQDLISEQTFMPSSGQSFEIQLQTPGETKTIKLYNDNPGNPAQVGLVYSDVYFKKSNFSADGTVSNLGRGGFFTALQGRMPSVGEEVIISLQFDNPKKIKINGSGIVRWRREEELNNLPAGCGVEFESIQEDSRLQLLEMVNFFKTKSFIPRK
jgi:hypothetical protein